MFQSEQIYDVRERKLSGAMRNSVKRLELIEKIDALRKRQYESSIQATFVGWTPQTIAEHNRCSDLIGLLFTQLANLSED
jgi:hypothetical protein